jgi:hypothetical protein
MSYKRKIYVLEQKLDIGQGSETDYNEWVELTAKQKELDEQQNKTNDDEEIN